MGSLFEEGGTLLTNSDQTALLECDECPCEEKECPTACSACSIAQATVSGMPSPWTCLNTSYSLMLWGCHWSGYGGPNCGDSRSVSVEIAVYCSGTLPWRIYFMADMFDYGQGTYTFPQWVGLAGSNSCPDKGMHSLTPGNEDASAFGSIAIDLE